MDWRNRALELIEQHGNKWQMIAETLTQELNEYIKPEKIRRMWRDMQPAKGNIVFEDKKPEPQAKDVDQYYKVLKQLDGAIDKLDTKQTKTAITIDDDKPIGICFWGDWHLGARGIDYEQFDKDKEIIKHTDGLYIVGTGDYKDNQNALVHASGVNEQIATPGMQDLLVERVWRDMKDQTLALVRGCHDDWDKRTADKDFIATLCSIAECVNLWHGGGIAINIGDQQYKLRVRHKYLGESGLNTTNSQRRMVDNLGVADINVVAHKHFSEIQETTRMGEDTIYARSGSYKYYDEYGQKLAGYRAILGVPVAILFPDRKHIIGFRYLEDGVSYLDAIRRNYA